MRIIDADQAVAEAWRLFNMYNLAMANAETNREINHILKRQELFKAVRAVAETCPTIDPVKHGHWNFIEQFSGGYYGFECSECHYPENVQKKEMLGNYCSYCGAKMDKEKREV